MKDQQHSRRWKKLFIGVGTAAAAALVLCGLALNGVWIPCLFQRITGLLCPGCGNTRVVLALLRLDLSGALRCNPLFPVEFFYLGWVGFHCCRRYLKGEGFSYQPPQAWLDGVILGLVLLWWVVRNLM